MSHQNTVKVNAKINETDFATKEYVQTNTVGTSSQTITLPFTGPWVGSEDLTFTITKVDDSVTISFETQVFPGSNSGFQAQIRTTESIPLDCHPSFDLSLRVFVANNSTTEIAIFGLENSGRIIINPPSGTFSGIGSLTYGIRGGSVTYTV